jgi:hypothetical protein
VGVVLGYLIRRRGLTLRAALERVRCQGCWRRGCGAVLVPAVGAGARRVHGCP